MQQTKLTEQEQRAWNDFVAERRAEENHSIAETAVRDYYRRQAAQELARAALVRYWAKRWLWYGGAIGLALVCAVAILRRW